MEVRPELANSSCSRLPKQKSSAPLPNLSRPQSWSSHVAGAHERHAFGPLLWLSCQAGTRKAEGSAALPSRVQQRCPRAPSPEPCKGRRPKNRHSKRRIVFVLVSWPACAGAFLVPCPWFSGPAPSGSFYVSFHWPRASRSSSQREGRRVKLRMGTVPRTGTGHRPKDRLFSGITLYAVRLHFLSYV